MLGVKSGDPLLHCYCLLWMIIAVAAVIVEIICQFIFVRRSNEALFATSSMIVLATTVTSFDSFER